MGQKLRTQIQLLNFHYSIFNVKRENAIKFNIISSKCRRLHNLKFKHALKNSTILNINHLRMNNFNIRLMKKAKY